MTSKFKEEVKIMEEECAGKIMEETKKYKTFLGINHNSMILVSGKN